MPKGVYPRKPGRKQNLSPEVREKFRQNLIRVISTSPNMKAARSANAKKAVSVRVARSILTHCPVGSEVGTSFTYASGKKTYTVIDPVPREIAVGRWEQQFNETIYMKIGGVAQSITSRIAVVWDYKPTIANIMESPLLEPRPEDSEKGQ